MRAETTNIGFSKACAKIMPHLNGVDRGFGFLDPSLMPVKKPWAGVLSGAAFLMATSAIGPGFLTQTAVFTEQLQAAFAFAILASVVIDIIVQLNVWRILGVSGLRAQDLANRVIPGMGHALAVAVVLGGLVFNIGNIAGTALGLNALAGVPLPAGALLSAGIAILVFLMPQMGRAMDWFTKLLGFLMIALVLFVAVKVQPPVGTALQEMVWPSRVDWMTVLTLVGGTVGGYISFAGAHRLLEAGLQGPEHARKISRGSIQGVTITGVMRSLLFLAVLGVVGGGQVLDPANPPASAFQLGAGPAGLRLFGLVLWAAAITSVVGASFTSISFLKTPAWPVAHHPRAWICGFIVVSTGLFLFLGKPVNLLIVAGALNGLILPFALGTTLLAAYRRDLLGSYRHPRWLTLLGILGVTLTAWMGVISLGQIAELFN